MWVNRANPTMLSAAQRRQVALVIATDLIHAVAAEFLQPRARQRDRQHRLADDARRRDDTDIAALVACHLDVLAAAHVHRGQRARQRGNRFHRHTRYDWLTVADPPLDAASVVGQMAPAGVVAHDIVNLRAGQRRQREPAADLDAFRRGNAHQRTGQPRIETLIPLAVSAQTDRDARRHDLEDAAAAVALTLARLDTLDHALRQLLVGAAHRRRLDSRPVGVIRRPGIWRFARSIASIRDGERVAVDLDAERRKELRADGAH